MQFPFFERMTRTSSLVIWVILSAVTIKVSAQQPSDVMLDKGVPECELKGPILFCDYKNSKENVTLSSLSEDIQKIFVYNVRTLTLIDYGCVNVTVHTAEEIHTAEEKTPLCRENIELSIKNSAINAIPNHVNQLYLEESVLSSLITSSKITKLITINSKIKTLEISEPLSPGTEAVFQNSEIESLQRLVVQEGSSLLLQKSNISHLSTSALIVSDASVIIRDSTIGTTLEDSLILNINSELTLEKFSGNLRITTNIQPSVDYSSFYYEQFIVCLSFLIVTLLLLVILLALYINLRFAKKKPYQPVHQEDRSTRDNKVLQLEESQPIPNLPEPKTSFLQSLWTTPPENKEDKSCDHIQDTTNRNSLGDPFLTLNNLENLNKSLWEKYKKQLEENKKVLCAMKKDVENKVSKSDSNLKATLKELVNQKNKEIYAVDKEYKNLIYYESNPLLKETWQRTNEVKKEQIEVDFKSKDHDKDMEAEAEKCKHFMTIVDKNKSIVNALFEEGQKVLTCLNTTRVTCKGTVGEVEQYEDIFDLYENELTRMLLEGRESFGKMETENRNIVRREHISLETVQNLNMKFREDIEKLNAEEKTEILISNEQEGGNISEKGNSLEDGTGTGDTRQMTDANKETKEDNKIVKRKPLFYLKRQVLKDNYLLDSRRHVQEHSESHSSLNNSKELVEFQENQIENLKRIISMILNIQKHYIRGAIQMGSRSLR